MGLIYSVAIWHTERKSRIDRHRFEEEIDEEGCMPFVCETDAKEHFVALIFRI